MSTSAPTRRPSVVGVTLAACAALLAVTLGRGRSAVLDSASAEDASSESGGGVATGAPSTAATDDASPFHRSLSAITALLTLSGLAYYAQAYLAALAFYGEFGVTPEDVAWSQTRAIARSAIVGLMFAVAVAVVVGVVFLFGYTVARLARAGSDGRRNPRAARAMTSVIWFRIGMACIVMGGGGFIAASLFSTDAAVRQAAEDLRAARDGTAVATFSSQVNGIDYSVGTATWTEPGPDGRAVRMRTIGALLGQANGTSIVYDLCTRAILRLPSGSLVLQERSSFVDPPTDPAPVTDEDRRSTCQPFGRTVN